MLGLTSFFVAQVLIGGAMCFDLVSFQFKNRRSILICFICASALIGVHFYLLGQFLAALLTWLSVFRFIVAYFSTNRRWMLVFLVILWGATYFLLESWISILAVIATILSTIGCFQLKDQNLRLWQMNGTALWVIHNALVFSPMAVLMELLFLSSNFIGYYRYYLRKK